MASIFAEFYADLNVPSSDIAAGFVLLSKYQAAQRQWILKNQQSNDVEQYLSSIPIKAETQFLDISTAEDSHLINDLIYYMNYSLAIFGWPMQIVDDPCMLCCIYPYLKLAPCSSSRPRRNSKKQHSIDERNDVNTNNNNNKQLGDKSEQRFLSGSVSEEQTNDVRETTTTQEDEEAKKKCNGRRVSSDARQATSNERGATCGSVAGKLDENCDRPIILADNCCSCNSASAERRLAEHNYEIIYISYRVNVNVIPFLVAADHSKRTIVVALRGSMSLSDMVTDMNGTVDRLPIENCPDDWLCHRGITRAAAYVKDTLLGEHILDRAFNCRPDLGSQEYNLVLCGHSLGAGAAAILGVLLRPSYPNLKAYLYSPPGGILSLPVVEYTKQFAIGIILGNDTVPRLGVAQLERLRYQTLLSLKSSEKSTGKILAKALCPSCCFGTNKVDYDPAQSLDILHGTEARSFDYNGNKIPFQVQPQVLYVPGKLIHIVKNYSFKSKTRRLFNEPLFQAIWTDNETYDRIMINEGMLFDHLPNHLMHAMKMLFSKTLPGRRGSRSSATPEITSTSLEVNTQPCGDRPPSSDLIPRREDQVTVSSEKVDAQVIGKAIEDDEDENNNNQQDANNNESSTLYPNLNNKNHVVDIGRFDKIEELNATNQEQIVGGGGGGPKDLDENGNERD